MVLSTYQPARIEDRLFIDGEFGPSISGKKFEVYNPTTEKLVASVYEAGVEDVNAAVQAANDAFPAWAALSAADRCAHILKLADAVEKNIQELGYLEAITMGKPVNDPTLRVAYTALRYFANKAIDVQGCSSLNSIDKVNITFRQPYGVTAAIIPWNVPLLMLLVKIGPALAAGNTIIVKSSEKSPLSSLAVARLCQEVSIPKGVINILSGYGRPCGEAMAKHMEIRKICFTGSVATGKAIQQAAAMSNLKNVTLELGGKSPLVIFDDADLARAVPAATLSILSNSGQVCVASSRIYVHANIADRFIEAMKKTMSEARRASNPLDSDSSRGPQVDKMQFDRVLEFVQYAKDNHITVGLGGSRIGDVGYFVEPTILLDAPEDSKVMKEEIFGPVVCINTFTDEKDVIKLANDTEFGLFASVFTKDVSRAWRLAKALEAGAIGVNCTSPVGAMDVPVGGWKQSGDGREFGKYCTDYWTEVKAVFFAL